MPVSSICTSLVASATPEDTVRDCARRMERSNVGALVVLDVDGKPRGVVTDRDLVTRCLAASRDPNHTTVEAVMTRPVRTVRETASIERAVAMMDREGLRRLVVTDRMGHVTGIVSLDDVILSLATEAARIGGILVADAPVPADP